jgi:hypothetical protein
MQTSHRHAARMKAQRMAWDNSVLGCLEESRFCGPRRSIGARPSITANEGPCSQHHARFSWPHTQRIPHLRARHQVQPAASDCPMYRITCNLCVLVLQPLRALFIYRHLAKSERMQLAKRSHYPTIRSLSVAQSSAPPETPDSPLRSAVSLIQVE